MDRRTFLNHARKHGFRHYVSNAYNFYRMYKGIEGYSHITESTAYVDVPFSRIESTNCKEVHLLIHEIELQLLFTSP